eukprot:scaffold421303_cov90-Attheya_sp.AAC.1
MQSVYMCGLLFCGGGVEEPVEGTQSKALFGKSESLAQHKHSQILTIKSKYSNSAAEEFLKTEEIINHSAL